MLRGSVGEKAGEQEHDHEQGAWDSTVATRTHRAARSSDWVLKNTIVYHMISHA